MCYLLKLRFPFLLVAVLLCAFSGCNSGKSDEEDLRLSEISEIFKFLPLHPTKVETATHTHSESLKASITKKYKSEASFDEVKQFYLEKLTEQGWLFVEERELKDRGRFKGEYVLHFNRDEFVLSVQFAGGRRADLGWDYAVRLAHPSDWIVKI